ncbi:MAG: hypothetical protein HYZ39_18090 [Mycolicibacterium cosmeticum]|nr:hypothetical protein [Mycolicibacterium cosmeticum]
MNDSTPISTPGPSSAGDHSPPAENGERLGLQPLLGLLLGAISGVIHPGLFYLLFPTWIIPALIAGLLSISPRTRQLALGFGAASVGWLAFSVAFFIFGAIGPSFR